MQLLHWTTAHFAGLSRLQTPLSTDSLPGKDIKIAVVGSGIAASSFLSRLHELQPSALVTVFERDAIVGGRMISSIHPYGEYQALESGASHFETDDTCLVDLLHKAGLKHGAEVPQSQLPEGNGFAHKATPQTSIRCDIDTPEWRRIRDLTWRYGRSFWRARGLLKSLVSQWQAFLDDTDGEQAELQEDLYGNATLILQRHGVGPRLQREVIHPCAKSRGYKGIAEDTALSVLLSSRQTTRTSVVGGNAQIAERTLDLAHELRVGTEVTRIASGSSRQLKIQYRSTKPDANYEESDFDMVVLAAPFSTSKIVLDLETGHDLISGLKHDYESRYVTYVASRQPLSSTGRFDYLDVCQLSDYISTSTEPVIHEIDAIGIRLKCGIHPCEDFCDDCGYENIYRIVSRNKLDDIELMDLISSVPGSSHDEARRTGVELQNATLEDHGISWIHRIALPDGLPKWQSVRDSRKHIELAPGLFYTAGLEHVVSSLELGCKMGCHTAGKVSLYMSEKL